MLSIYYISNNSGHSWTILATESRAALQCCQGLTASRSWAMTLGCLRGDSLVWFLPAVRRCWVRGRLVRYRVWRWLAVCRSVWKLCGTWMTWASCWGRLRRYTPCEVFRASHGSWDTIPHHIQGGRQNCCWGTWGEVHSLSDWTGQFDVKIQSTYYDHLHVIERNEAAHNKLQNHRKHSGPKGNGSEAQPRLAIPQHLHHALKVITWIC